MARIYLTFFLLTLEVDVRQMLAKYADDCNIISPGYNTSDRSEALVKQFMKWSSNDGMPCNPRKGREIAFRKKGVHRVFVSFANQSAPNSWCYFPGRLSIYYSCTHKAN